MDITQIQQLFLDPERREAIKKATNTRSSRPTALCGLPGSSAAIMLASLDRREPVLVIGDNLDDAGYLYHDLSRLHGDRAVLMFPSGYRRSIKYGQVDPPSQILRTEALSRWNDPATRFIVTYPEALAESVATPESVATHSRTLATGTTVDAIDLTHWLRENNFTEVDYVYEPGQWARRGSILDIFGYSREVPVRIDFFGDEIESIRTFNIETQLSDTRLQSVEIAANLTTGTSATISLLQFIPTSTLIALRDRDYITSRIQAIANDDFSTSALQAGEGDTASMAAIVNPDDFAQRLNAFKTLSFNAAHDLPGAIDCQCSPQGIYHKNFDLIADSFTSLLRDGYTLYILSDSPKQFDRLRDIFNDRGDKITFTPVDGTLHEGFIDHAQHRCYFTDHQIFDRFHKYTLRSDRARSGKLALSLKELQAIEPGDYIVHIDHGIGRFGGLVHTDVNGRPQEMIKLIYQNNDFIFVSIHALHKLSKYRGKEGTEPRISKIGSGAWARIKEKTKNHLKDIARDLIRLYAARRDEQGHAFAPDSFMQQELEASFIYEDTPDQLTATQAVKADMESPRPMDRLICGDVGFGKTEIAIRAAFKAAADGKQVAVLVPTTVLAYQHYQTFSQRLKDFPVRVDYLSRARTPRQVKEILDSLAKGEIDILIGTHKLIGKTVRFHDLGLLIVDEEQKFGVAVKERLKQLKTNVDTLTMSATPIPRTLQFSLMGARDLSAITTPPPNRYPIITTGGTLSDELLSEAINFELSRNGQVFIINNRIEQLYELEAQVKRAVPDARTLVAHGQLPPERLEKAIIDFANHDYDILLSTTIVESGIDMPNVNTIIINNAHCFGLSELHQLRGRVGRSSRKAFCYLLTPPGLPLTPVAHRRLQAIECHSDLGSGIQIAMQDLDIRGAGNLLGAEQSGFIADLGYEAYQRILQEAVTELRTQEFPDILPDTTDPNSSPATVDYITDTTIESDLELLLPATYAPLESERIALYRELDNIERDTDLQAFRDRLLDRFGPIPHVTDELLLVPGLRIKARRLGIEKVTLKQGTMYLYFVDESNRAYYQSPMFGRLLHYLQQNPRRVNIRDRQGRRSFTIADVTSVTAANDILRDILALDTI